MNSFSMRFVAELLTTALIHFVWQGAVLTLMLLIIVTLLDVRTARLRYLLSVGALLAMGLAPVLTISLHQNGKVAPRHFPVDKSVQSNLVVEEQFTTVRAVHSAVGLEEASTTLWNPTIEVYVLIAWLAGVLILSTRLAIGFGVTLWIRANVKPLSEEFEQRVRILGDRLSVDTRNRVFTCVRAGQAVAIGFIRPVVLIPVAWLTQLTPEMLEAVIAHELAHIRRWDLWVNLVQRVIETLLFYHPAVWWLSRRIRLEREMCCDEIAVRCLGRAVYARSLESVARIAHGNLLTAASINGGNKMNLLRRIRYLLGIAPAEAAGNWWAIGLVAIILPFATAVAFSLAAGTTPSVAMADEILDESKALEKIELLGGKVTRDDTLPGKPVIEIDFSGSERLNDKYMSLLKSFKGLKVLNLDETEFTDIGMKQLGDFKNLTAISLKRTKITDAGLKDISTLKNLTMLDLQGTDVSNVGLKYVAELKHLTSLSLTGTKITNAGTKEIRKLKNLTTLKLDSIPITDSGLEELSELNQLTTLILARTKLTNAGLDELNKHKQLMTLNLVSLPINDEDLKKISELTKLTSLSLGLTQITDNGLRIVGKRKSLTELDLSLTAITDNGMREISGLNNLTFLILTATPITNTGLEEICKLKNLTVLNLNMTKITDIGLMKISELEKLNMLFVTGTKITDKSLKDIRKLKSLTNLALQNTAISDAGVNDICELKNLKILNITSTAITDNGVKHLNESLPQLKITK